MARDAARTLRLVGTVNSKNGRLVETILSPGTVWSFDAIANEILPFSREELRAMKAAKGSTGRLWVPGENLDAERLWNARLVDLQTLLRLRWWGELPPGERDSWLFWAGVAVSWLTEPKTLRRELFHLAREVTTKGRIWTDQETKNRLYSVIDRANRAARGETITWRGRQVDPRYHGKRETMLDDLNISEDEQQHMQTLIGPEIRQDRRRQSREMERRERGMIERRLYELRAEHLRRRVYEFREEGMSVAGIARALDISRRHVHRILADDALIVAAAGGPPTETDRAPGSLGYGDEERLLGAVGLRPIHSPDMSHLDLEGLEELEGDDEEQ